MSGIFLLIDVLFVCCMGDEYLRDWGGPWEWLNLAIVIVFALGALKTVFKVWRKV